MNKRLTKSFKAVLIGGFLFGLLVYDAGAQEMQTEIRDSVAVLARDS